MSRQIRVLLVEDDEDWIEGIRWMIEKADDLVFLGAARDRTAALQLIQLLDVDVVLLDIMLDQRPDGISLISDMLELRPDAKLIMLSSMEDGAWVSEAFLWGAHNYIVKSSDYHDIPQAIRQAYRDDAGIHPSSARIVRSEFMRIHRERMNKLLTAQEKRLLGLVAEGRSTAQILELLQIEEHSLANHITNINKKLGTKNRKEAAQFAQRKGLLDEAEPS
ncbi:response regulator transcription factor [Paenibacillus athensensis]|nr:response regulator transcription factor [Paenibacillus athensensis]MCD1257709.1 response regulator transcription factor [Paenibacillus athensensis]